MAETLDWLKFELAKGLTTLTLLRLKNAPPVDAAEETIEVWFRTLTFGKTWDEQLDRKRFETAFWLLAQRCDSFPTPKLLLDTLPRRSEPKQLPRPPLTDEQIARNQARIAELKQRLKGGMRC